MNKLFPCNKREGVEGSICKNCGTSHTITEELLKRMAIEDIRDRMKIVLCGYKIIIPSRLDKIAIAYTEIDYIKKRFNITEVDLK